MNPAKGPARPMRAGAAASAALPSDSSRRLLPWLVAVAFFMESLDTTILNTAVPVDRQALHVAPLSMKSVLASYTLSLARLHPGQRLDGGSLRHAPGVRLGHRHVHARARCLCGLSSEHPPAGRLPHPAGLRRRDDGAGRPAHAGAHLRQVRAVARHELRRHSRR